MNKKIIIATGVAALLASGVVLANNGNAISTVKKKTNVSAMAKKVDYNASCNGCGASCDAMCGGCNAAAGCGACGGAACGADACGGACGGCIGDSSY